MLFEKLVDFGYNNKSSQTSGTGSIPTLAVGTPTETSELAYRGQSSNNNPSGTGSIG
ncbi:MAG: hypothetical protein HYW51_03825 [Candidatus Doudnabacteria bacterium]|nr:hypothetical protein [Candidatus Doudnabacteria bacterium]